MRKEKQLHERVEACEQEIAALKSQRHCPASERQDTAHGNGLALGFRQVSMPARRVYAVIFSTAQTIFDGAQWMRDEDPADPFAEPPPSYSQDNDLP